MVTSRLTGVPKHFRPFHPLIFSSPVLLRLGCKVDVFDLKVEAVNTHRDRPLVSFCCFFFTFYCLISIKKMFWRITINLTVMVVQTSLWRGLILISSNQNKHRCSGPHNKYTHVYMLLFFQLHRCQSCHTCTMGFCLSVFNHGNCSKYWETRTEIGKKEPTLN